MLLKVTLTEVDGREREDEATVPGAAPHCCTATVHCSSTAR